MVKGVNRRVIVVRAPDPKYFEEAIFIVKEGAQLDGVDATAVLEEAQMAARNFVRGQSYTRSIFAKIPPWAYLGAGALLSAGFFGIWGLL